MDEIIGHSPVNLIAPHGGETEVGMTTPYQSVTGLGNAYVVGKDV